MRFERHLFETVVTRGAPVLLLFYVFWTGHSPYWCALCKL
jgi:hypothetical protein